MKSIKLGFSFNNVSSVCDVCQRAKSHQRSYSSYVHVTSSPLELIYTDVWGPTQVSNGGFRYYVCFLDDYNHYTWVYFIKHKSYVEQVFYDFPNHVERLLNTKIHIVQSDRSGEFHKLHKY